MICLIKKAYLIETTNSLSCINTYGMEGIAPGNTSCNSDQIFCKVNTALKCLNVKIFMLLPEDPAFSTVGEQVFKFFRTG